MPGNVRVTNNSLFDQAFLNQALGRIGVTIILTEPNGTVECNMTQDQLNLFQQLFPQYPVQQAPTGLQVTPDQPAPDTYEDQNPPAPDTGLEGGGLTVSPDPTPN